MSDFGLGLSAFQTFTFTAHDSLPYEGRSIVPMLELRKKVQRGRVAELDPVATEGQKGWTSGD